MLRTKLFIVATALTMLFGSTNLALAKPGKGNGHGPKKANHGQMVSAAARSKDKGHKNHDWRDDDRRRNDWDDNWRNSNWRDDRQQRRYRSSSSTRQRRINEAVRERNEAIREAHRDYARRRRDILDDDNGKRRLTDRQRRKLREALRERDRAIREAQREYQRTVNNLR